jgi:uncharacterized protein (TIGR02246 family)
MKQAQTADLDLTITRLFDAPRDLVFKAWTDLELGRRWSAPYGFTVPASEGELRVGGAWRLCMRRPGEKDLWVGGVYREIVVPERLVFTHAWEDAHGTPGHETLVTVTLAERRGKTEMTFTQTGFESVESRDGHGEGWSECFDQLAEVLAAARPESADEAEIRALIEKWAQAIRDKDIDRRMSNYARDVLLFDVVNPLRYTGADAVRKRGEEWFGSFQGPIGYEIRDLRISVGGGVAFSHSLNRVSATRKDGRKLDMWWRATVCYRKLDGKWTVTHEHNSVPFDTATGKASLDLRP